MILQDIYLINNSAEILLLFNDFAGYLFNYYINNFAGYLFNYYINNFAGILFN